MSDETVVPRPNPAANPPEPTSATEDPASRPKSGVFGFGATASAYFIAVAVLFIIFVAVILVLQR
jgi:hypothetical protein